MVNQNTPVDMEELEAGADYMNDPQLSNMVANEDASPEQEQMLGEAIVGIMDFVYSEEGMASIVQIFNQDQRELYEQVPDIGEMILQKAYADMASSGQEPDSAVFFGDGGLLQQLPPMLFEIAETIGKPGADDPQQMEAAMIGLYQKAGQYILDKDDTDAKQQAIQLGMETILTGEDGELMEPAQIQKQMKTSAQKEVPAGVRQGLLGV